MNLNNINKSDLRIMCNRVDHIRESLLKDLTVFDRYSPRYNYLYKVVMRLIRQIHKINSNYTLCAYCLNGLDHNLNDHELAVERQKVTNELKSFLNDFDFHPDCSLCLSHKIHDITAHESALKRSNGKQWFYEVYIHD